MIVSVKEVTKDYILGKQRIPALKGVSLEVEKGEFLAISGPSGSGKTTLLNIIGCIEKKTSGKVLIGDVDVDHQSDDVLSDIRLKKIGFIFQQFNLIPVLNAFENVEYPLIERNLREEDRQKKVKDALHRVGLDDFSSHKPLELSGGQRQRVAIARAIVGAPLIVLADEPTANLDKKTGIEILDLMKEINQEQKTTFIFSTHDPKVLERASRIVSLTDGLVC